MKKSSLLIIVAAILFSACNSSETKNQDTNNQQEIQTAEAPKIVKGKVVELNNVTFRQLVHDYKSNPKWNYIGDKPSIVDFYADWCAPCRRIAPILDELAYEYADYITIYKVNVDYEAELAQTYNIQSLPTLLFIPINADPVLQIGAYSKTDYKNMIEKILINN